MTLYTLLDPVTGQQWAVPEFKLTRNLRHNCILLRNEEHIGIITHRDLVIFARWCAGEMLARLKGKPDKNVSHALSLVDRWLENQQSVTSKELEAAARATWPVIRTAQAAAQPHEAAWAAARAAENACDVRISYETQAQWLVEHLKSGK